MPSNGPPLNTPKLLFSHASSARRLWKLVEVADTPWSGLVINHAGGLAVPVDTKRCAVCCCLRAVGAAQALWHPNTTH